MDHRKWNILACCGFLIVACATSAHARQNIIVGDLSVGYEVWDRNDEPRPVPETGNQTGEDAAATGTEVILIEDNSEGRNRYFIQPRVSFTSTGITDQISLTYAPRINLEEDDYTNHIDHDFGLQAEKDFSRAWSASLSDKFFLGDDALRESDTRTAVIGSPAEDEGEESTAPTAGEEDRDGLTERVGSRRFWRNEVTLSTDYTYREDSVVGVGFSYGLLRNVDDDIGGYTEYDRYNAMLNVSYRFNQQWLAEVDGWFTRGIFDDEAEVLVVRVNPGEDDIAIDVADVSTSDDLREYDVSSIVTYDWSLHDNSFVDYHFLATEYDHPLRDDAWVHEIALGWSHDFTRQLHLTVSGGPSFIKREQSSWESDYNASVALTKDFFHSSLSLSGSKGYDQQDFDGRRSGLTDTWRVGADYSYQFTENLTGLLSGGYSNSRREQPPAVDAVVIIEGENNDPGDIVLPEGFEYTDEFYDAGVNLSYSFLRWYSVTGGYRY